MCLWNNLLLAWGTLSLGEAFQWGEKTSYRSFWKGALLIPGHWISYRNSQPWRKGKGLGDKGE